MDPDVAITMAWVTGSSEEAAQSDLNGTLESPEMVFHEHGCPH